MVINFTVAFFGNPQIQHVSSVFVLGINLALYSVGDIIYLLSIKREGSNAPMSNEERIDPSVLFLYPAPIVKS